MPEFFKARTRSGRTASHLLALAVVSGFPIGAAAADPANSIESRLDRLDTPQSNAPSDTKVQSADATVADAAGQAPTATRPKAHGSEKVAASPPKLSIEERLSRLEAAAATAPAPLTPSPPSPPSPPSDAKVEFNNLRPVIKSADGRNELALRATIQFDAAAYMQDAGNQGAAVPADQRDLGSGALFRRLRIGVEGKFFQDFIYELRFEFGGSDVEGSGAIDIARIGYTGIPNLRLQLGAMQPIVTLSDPTSSGELTLLERPSVITTMLPVFGGESGRRGAEATFQETDFFSAGDNLLVSGAFTGQKIGTAHSGSSLDDEGTQALGRIAYRFYSDDETNLQVGASGADLLSISGTTPDGARVIRFRDRPEARVSGDRLIDTDNIPAEGAGMFGLEAAGNVRNFYADAEWYAFNVTRDRNCSGCSPLAGDPNFSGWYVEGTWVLTGENRRYMASGTANSIGVWSGPKPKKPFGEGDGIGAWEVMARYSEVDLNWNQGVAGSAAPTGGIRGGEQSVFALGVNWYLNANLRLMTDFQWVNVDRLSALGADAGQSFEVLESRAQFAF